MITSPRKLCVGGVNAGCDSAHFKTRGVTFNPSVIKLNLTRKVGQMHLYKKEEELIKHMLMEYLSLWDHHNNTYGLMRVLHKSP